MSLEDLMKRAGELAPMHSDAVPILQGRTLYVDGDGLAYACAGNDDTLPSEARARVREKLDSWRRASGSSKVVILLTGSGGTKGDRYAIARVKPYQGQRANSRRPKNWQVLRESLELGTFGGLTILDFDREADDRFGQFGWADPENTVIATQDKDIRMVPGFHINWADHRMFYLPPNTYDMVHNGLQYGHKWFWMQMLMGDTADFIPGLPKVGIGGKLKLCGEVTAGNILLSATTSEEAGRLVSHAYHSYYGDRWLVEMAEQACLLWMRMGKDANWFEALAPEGPLGFTYLTNPKEHAAAEKELSARVQEAKELNDLATQSL